MYRPLHSQLSPNQKFSYTETIVSELSDIVICMWELNNKENTDSFISNLMEDGCINFVVNLTAKSIFYSPTHELALNLNSHYIGFRLKPGAFYALTDIDTPTIMNKILPLATIDETFNQISFFALDVDEMKKILTDYLVNLQKQAEDLEFIRLFDQLHEYHFLNPKEVYEFVNFTPRHTQRLFKKHYGLTPKKIISIIDENLSIL